MLRSEHLGNVLDTGLGVIQCITQFMDGMHISGFDWDEGNILHLALGHGIEPEEAEEVFAVAPLFRRTKRGHYATFGPTQAGRLLVIVFEKKRHGLVRVITGWDMGGAERPYYQQRRRG